MWEKMKYECKKGVTGYRNEGIATRFGGPDEDNN
jgi:hypothetical protein